MHNIFLLSIPQKLKVGIYPCVLWSMALKRKVEFDAIAEAPNSIKKEKKYDTTHI